LFTLSHYPDVIPSLPRLIVTLLAITFANTSSSAANRQFRAGAFAVDITPTKLPAIVNGGFREKTSNTVYDRLHARALVLDDGQERIALVVVDSCMVPRDLCDQAKALANKISDIPTDRILISSTHTHSAPSAMGALGSSADPDYIKELPAMIAAAIGRANERLQLAQIGWGVVDAPEHTYCRRWILRSDKMRKDPFGETTVRAMMHPGHQNPAYIGPSGPVDTGLSLLAVKTADGFPLAMFANFSMHYYGSGAISADYYGAFASEFAKLLEMVEDDDGFVAAMSQGTSGDLQWMDYGQPRPKRDRDQYAAELAAIAHKAYEQIEFKPWVPLAMAEAKLSLNRRVADEERLKWARKIAATLKKRKPISQPEIYAREQVFIADSPVRELILQAVRIGDLGITAIPNEVYSITGLKLKALSPLRPTFNIELANGGEGYIPPPEQHRLGGYTTWEARSAALETNAEPKIVDTLLTLLEKVSGKPRAEFAEADGEYANGILAAKPAAYWRLGELAGDTAADSSGNRFPAHLKGQFALHLQGPSGHGFSEPNVFNRAIQFAGGTLATAPLRARGNNSIEFWFWNGLPPSAREVVGTLASHGTDNLSLVRKEQGDTATLRLSLGKSTATGKTALRTKSWHHVVLVREGDHVTLWLDGRPELKITAGGTGGNPPLIFAGDATNTANFEGRLDEIALYEHALRPAEIRRHFEMSGMNEWRHEQHLAATRKTSAIASRATGPSWNTGYPEAVSKNKPALHWQFHELANKKVKDFTPHNRAGTIDGNVTISTTGKRSAASFLGGRVKADIAALPMDYSAGFWFRNDLPNNSQPVTAYLFSRGPDGDRNCPGDHIGIGGNYRDSRPGRLFIYNGNKAAKLVLGKTVIQPRTWNHVVFVRKGEQVTAYLNGRLEFAGPIATTIDAKQNRFYFGGRNDNFANLNGMLDEAVVFDRALSEAEAKTLYESAGVSAPTKPAKEIAAELESKPLPPSAGRRSINVPKGFTVELVAAEPLVKDPVAIDWGIDGRLWVAEMADYPSGMDNQGKPGGRIRVLRDIDGDGRYESSELFLDGLNFPNGVMAWKKGVLITAAPEILYAEDTNGDGKADVKKVMYAGFHEGNQQLRVNGLRRGLDGWICCASGAHHSGYGKQTKIRSHTGKVFELGSRDFKIRPAQGDLVPLSGPSQFGRARDDWGNWFGVQNSYPIWHYVIEDTALQRNPDIAYPSPKKLLTERNPRIYPAKQPQKRFHNFSQSGRFTSACSVAIYRDELLFSRDQTHAFTCEPFHNLVQHNALTPEGVSFRINHDPALKVFDFFTSTDRWCRPVQVRTGPDGALWVVDMYRYMIEHPQWLPTNGKEELRPHYRAGEERGRIYRVFRKDNGTRPVRYLANASDKRIVAAALSPNGTVRDQALPLIRRNLESKSSQTTANFLDSYDPKIPIHRSLHDELFHPSRMPPNDEPDPRARRLRYRRLADVKLTTLDFKDLADAIREEKDPKVRLEIALMLGNQDHAIAGDLLAEYANADLHDPHMRAAILSSLPPHFDTVVAKSIIFHKGLQHPLFSDLLRLERKRGSDLPVMMNILTKPTDGAYTPQQFRILADWLQSLSRERANLTSVLQQSTKMFSAARRDIAKNEAAIALLGYERDQRSNDLERLTTLLSPTTSPDIQRAAVGAITRQWRSTAVKVLSGHWRTLSPALRQTAVGELLAQTASAKALLQAIAKGDIAPSTISPSQRQSLARNRNAELRRLAAKALNTSDNSDRQAVLKRFQPALRIAGNQGRGKEIYDRLCLVCHRTDQPVSVGPDLRSITDKSSAGLLTAILDPNQSVDPRYLAYTIVLRDDSSFSGRIMSESGNGISLLTAEGKPHTILRSQIAHLQGSRLSMMPEGLESGLTPQQVADLIAFVRELK